MCVIHKIVNIQTKHC